MFKFWFEKVVKEDERGFLYRDGAFERRLSPGRHAILDLRGKLTCETFKVVRADMPIERARLFASTQPALAAECLEIVQCGAHEVAIVDFDGDPKHLVLPNTSRAYWKVVTRVTVETIDAAATLRVDKRHLDRLDLARTTCVVAAVVEAHEAGLLKIDGELRERLPPGRHAFWQVGRIVKVDKIDLRPQPLEITAQEILTKDRIGIRVTLTAFIRIVAPETAALASADVPNTIYKLVQFAIREAVATRTLDDILAARELLNKVVEAERVARANNIRRQEETASTRSLLNTAKLMENNPLLLRLKELEALEKLVEKVGRIDMHTGHDGMGALLSKLYTLGEAKPGE